MQIDITFYIGNCPHFGEHLREIEELLPIMDGFQEFILTCLINATMWMNDCEAVMVTQVDSKRSHLQIVAQSG